MNLKTLRQILKGCGDDTRLRILNILHNNEFTVKEICTILAINQPTVSKHLTKLRLLKLVNDRRVGNSVYYSLGQISDIPQRKITAFIISRFAGIVAFKKDGEIARKLRKK